MRIVRAVATGLLVTALALATAACGADDGTDAASSSASGAGSGSASGTSDGECTPVGTDLADEADETVDIALDEYGFDPDDVEVDAGVVTFHAENVGTMDHEIAFLPGGGDVPLDDDGAPDEAALEEAGAFELEGFGPDQTCDATFDLAPGTYTMFCILETPDGDTHASQGMVGRLTVD